MAIHEYSVIVRKPVHEVFMKWEDLESFPNLMSHVHEVTKLHGDTYHWKGKVAGIEEEWDAEITKMEPDRLIAWRSISGFRNSGQVRFDPMENATKLTVHYEYTPPAGIIGEAAETVYVGREFDKTLREDLENFKSSMEKEQEKAA